MDSYTGFEPQVGEVRALRTFRVGPGGVLYSLFGSEEWRDGVNAASCRVDSIEDCDEAHRVPEPECGCGFYAYGFEQAAGEYGQARHVLAVIACWGRVIAGTRGVRAQYARVEALWLSGAVPSALAAALAARYGSAIVYESKARMYSEHPVTVLSCYERPVAQRSGWAGRRGLAAFLLAVASSVPPRYWWESWGFRAGLLAALLICAVAGIVGARATMDRVSEGRRRLLWVAVSAWVLAGAVGGVGWLLIRAPMLVVAALIGVQRRREAVAARRFPAVIDERKSVRWPVSRWRIGRA